MGVTMGTSRVMWALLGLISVAGCQGTPAAAKPTLDWISQWDLRADRRLEVAQVASLGVETRHGGAKQAVLGVGMGVEDLVEGHRSCVLSASKAEGQRKNLTVSCSPP